MAIREYLCKIGVVFVIICIISHFSGWKDICQSDSHISKLLRFSWSFSQSVELWIVKYRRVSSAKSRTVLLETYSGRSFM